MPRQKKKHRQNTLSLNVREVNTLRKVKSVGICVCVYIYIYIYIVIHRQTVSFYQNSSVWLDTQDARSRDRNFMVDCVSDHSSTKRTTLAKGILRYFYF